MAHRLTHGYEGRCASLHGHEYVAEIGVAGELDEMGLAVDFGDVKAVCLGWVKEHLDHSTIVAGDDAALLSFLTAEKQRHYVVAFNTTAENIAGHLLEIFQGRLDESIGKDLKVVRLRLFETPASWVEVP